MRESRVGMSDVAAATMRVKYRHVTVLGEVMLAPPQTNVVPEGRSIVSSEGGQLQWRSPNIRTMFTQKQSTESYKKNLKDVTKVKGGLATPTNMFWASRASILGKLPCHDNVLVPDVVIDKDEPESVYIEYPYFDTNFERITGSSNVITIHHLQYFIYCSLRGLKYLHSADVAPNDICPEGISINQSDDICIRLCNIGRHFVGFQAPELLLDCHDVFERSKYSPERRKAADIWSMGILALRLLRCEHLPKSPASADEYIRSLCKILGSPPLDLYEDQPEVQEYFRTNITYSPPIPWDKLMITEPLVQEFLDKTLHWDPSARLSVNDLLKLPLFEDLHLKEDEPVYQGDESWDPPRSLGEAKNRLEQCIVNVEIPE